MREHGSTWKKRKTLVSVNATRRDREYRNAKRSGHRGQGDEEDDYKAGPRWASSPQYPQTTQQYPEQQSGQYLTSQPRDAGYLDPRLYQIVQGAQDTAGVPCYGSGSPPTNPYQDQPPTSYGQNQLYPAPRERREESSRRRQSCHSGESGGTEQEAGLHPLSEDEVSKLTEKTSKSNLMKEWNRYFPEVKRWAQSW